MGNNAIRFEEREERHARGYDGRAVLWRIYRIAERDARILIATKQRGSELQLLAGRYHVYAFELAAGFPSESFITAPKPLDMETIDVEARGIVLHCGKNLPSSETAGDPRRERDLHAQRVT